MCHLPNGETFAKVAFHTELHEWRVFLKVRVSHIMLSFNKMEFLGLWSTLETHSSTNIGVSPHVFSPMNLVMLCCQNCAILLI